MDEGISYKPEHYAQQFLKNLCYLRTTDAFCDVTLRVGDTEFRAHRNVLAAASPYFQVNESRLILQAVRVKGSFGAVYREHGPVDHLSYKVGSIEVINVFVGVTKIYLNMSIKCFLPRGSH